MKKQLLLATSLMAAISAFPQANLRRVDLGQKLAQKYRAIHSPVETLPFEAPSTTPKKFNLQARSVSTSTSVTTINWDRYTGSENIYGMLVSTSRPLQYNDELGAISFVHRKSHTYNANPLPSPTASTGVVVADITYDWGMTWDSTALWSNNTFWARYPNGGIYNPPTNTNPAQAYIIGTGPVTTAADTWQGNWFASKRLDNVHGSSFNNTPSTVAGAQQFIANTGTAVAQGAPVGKVDFARLDFTYTDDGAVHALGQIQGDANGTTFGTQLVRGARVLSATFNSSTGTFNWTGDSIIPNTVISTLDNHAMILGDPHMAWKEDGSVGYVFFIGCRSGATGNNIGNQPIVYTKTANSSTWTLVSAIDFNSPAMNAVTGHLPKVSDSNTLTIPFFNTEEGIDGIVDANGDLHIMTCVKGTSSSNPDSLNASFESTNSLDGETYTYEHIPGRRPYIYDFTYLSSSTSWNVLTIDSMGSENPGWFQASDDGFLNNPWDIDPMTNSKVAIDARLQMSRTPDGQFIAYTWSESDSATTNNGVKWNYNPNLKARFLAVTNTTMMLSPTEFSVTSPSNINDANPEVRGFAYNHYVSPKCMFNSSVQSPTTTLNLVTLTVPMTVSNNEALHQREPINHYFSAAPFTFLSPSGFTTSISSESINSAKASVIYPNPARGNAYLAIDLKDNSPVYVTVTSLVGQQVKASETAGQIGQNRINIDLSGISKGIYLVNVKAGASISTKKLVIE